MNHLRMLTSQLGSGNARRVSYHGREHVYVPAVGLLADIVVEGIYSEGREFVGARVLADGASTFNKKPLFTFHPHGGADAAPGYRFGEVGKAAFSRNALQLDVYLDPAAAVEVGGEDGEESTVIRRVLANETVEISVGAWVYLDKRHGYSPSGEAYEWEWVSMSGDHVSCSLLAHGGRGSCSISKGCGLNRSLSANAFATEVHMCDNANCSCNAPPDPWGVSPALARALGFKPTAAERVPTAASLARALKVAGPGSKFADGRVLDAAGIPSGYATAALVYNNG